MIEIVIKKLREIQNTTSDKLADIFEGKQEKVAESFYSSTIFESQEKYNTLMDVYSNNIFVNFQKTLVETPLIFTKGKCTNVFYSSKSQGIDFGVTLIDYISKKPLVVCVCEKSGQSYTIKILVYDIKTKTYVDGSTTSNPTSVKELFDTFTSNVSTLINQFKTN